LSYIVTGLPNRQFYASLSIVMQFRTLAITLVVVLAVGLAYKTITQSAESPPTSPTAGTSTSEPAKPKAEDSQSRPQSPTASTPTSEPAQTKKEGAEPQTTSPVASTPSATSPTATTPTSEQAKTKKEGAEPQTTSPTTTSPTITSPTASTPTDGAQSTTPEVKKKERKCIDCHGPFDKLAGMPANVTAPSGEKINPHRYVPHDSKEEKDVPECLQCHTAHPLSPKPDKGSIDLSKVSLQYCYTCHHDNTLKSCKECHP
jgi:hypothetical protein